MASKLKDVDKGFDEFVRTMKKADGLRAQSGIQGAEAMAPHDDFGNRNIDIAVFHEFGTSTAPERSFIRATFDRQRSKYDKLVQRAVAAGIDGKDMVRAFGRLALLMEADMRETIDRSIGLAPLKQSTVRARKRARTRATGGLERPLLNTAQLKLAITAVVKT